MEGMTELCRLANYRRTDKYQRYTPVYYELLKDKKYSFKKILELGVGWGRKMRHVKNYRVGASLYMWRDFFPNAQIYGADCARAAMFEDDRIQTQLCDVRRRRHLKRLIQWAGSDIDLVVDDANHLPGTQLEVFNNLMPMVKKEVIYIIEDAGAYKEIVPHLEGFEYSVYDDRSLQAAAIIIRNKDAD